MVETRHLIMLNQNWLADNKARRNSVYWQMVENKLEELKQHLEFIEQYQELDS